MRICLITTALLALAAPVASAPVQDPCEDEDNVFTAPASGSKLFTDTWAEGGPSSWGGGTAVYGGICFDVSGSSGTVIVDGIDRDYTNITGLHTSDSADPTTLVLEGSGSLSFYNGGEQITIEPRVGLTLSVETIFNGDVHLNTQYMMTSQGEQMTIEDSMTLTQANAALTISGPSYVQFTNDATLSMDGTIVVGQQAGNSGLLQIDSSDSLDGDIGLQINGIDSRVLLGTGGSSTQTFVFTGLSGDGNLTTQSSNASAHVQITGGNYSEFTGTLGIQGDLNVHGENTVLYYQQDASGTHAPSTVEGDVHVTDGASFFIGRNEVGGTRIPTLYAGSLTVEGGGMFGGDGWLSLGSGPTLNILDGWLVGGDYWTGQGQLVLEGTFTGTFNEDAGIHVTVDTDNPNTAPSYITWNTPATVMLGVGANIHVRMIGDTYLSSQTELTLMQSTALSPQGEPMDLILAPGLGFFDLTTNRVTRYLEVVSPEPGGFFPSTDKLIVRVGADYEAPAADLEGIGRWLNSLIPFADEHPDSPEAVLLGLIDAYAFTLKGYLEAISWHLPTVPLVADSAAANTMFYDVQRRNLRELAIGSRAPGMVKAAHPALYASHQEQDAVEAAAVQHPQVIIQPNGRSKPESGVFHSLFVDGYGQWSSMNSIGYVPGYTSTAAGVAAGWGIGLSHGLTVGITGGWEHNRVDVDDQHGHVDLDSFRGAPFLSWSGLLDSKVEQYAILSAGGAYNYGTGRRQNIFGVNRSMELHGWQFDVEGTVGTRVPLGETVAFQPEASIRYAVVHFDGDETQGGSSYDYQGDDFQFVNGRVGFGMEWFPASELRTTARLGYQGQYYNWGTATWTFPATPLNPRTQVSESPGSGSINQVYVGLQLEWAPSWNVAVSLNYDGAFGQATQNSISGGVLFRF